MERPFFIIEKEEIICENLRINNNEFILTKSWFEDTCYSLYYKRGKYCYEACLSKNWRQPYFHIFDLEKKELIKSGSIEILKEIPVEVFKDAINIIKLLFF